MCDLRKNVQDAKQWNSHGRNSAEINTTIIETAPVVPTPLCGLPFGEFLGTGGHQARQFPAPTLERLELMLTKDGSSKPPIPGICQPYPQVHGLTPVRHVLLAIVQRGDTLVDTLLMEHVVLVVHECVLSPRDRCTTSGSRHDCSIIKFDGSQRRFVSSEVCGKAIVPG